MKTREQIIKAFEQCLVHGHGNCEDCYQDGPGFGIACWKNVCSDVLALLKEQETVVRCKDCKHWSTQKILDYRICDRWQNQGIKNFATMGNWFCADGERKDDK